MRSTARRSVLVLLLNNDLINAGNKRCLNEPLHFGYLKYVSCIQCSAWWIYHWAMGSWADVVEGKCRSYGVVVYRQWQMIDSLLQWQILSATCIWYVLMSLKSLINCLYMGSWAIIRHVFVHLPSFLAFFSLYFLSYLFTSLLVFTVRRYASMVYAVVMFFCLSVTSMHCTKTTGAIWPTLCCKRR